MAPPTFCTFPGCSAIVERGRCDLHRDDLSRNHGGASRQSRGLGADWDAVRRLVLERDGYRCRIRGPRCKGKASTVDHRLPRHLGGARLDPANLVAACWSCNYGKGGRTTKIVNQVVRIVGAPATGKSWLRERLGAQVPLLTYSIDDERMALLRPGEVWPDDGAAWRRLAEVAHSGTPCIIETSGRSPRDRQVFDGTATLTIECLAPEAVRRQRLVERVHARHPLARTAGYVERLMLIGRPSVAPDVVWFGQETAPIANRIRAWLAGRGLQPADRPVALAGAAR